MKTIQIVSPFLSGHGGTETVIGMVMSNEELRQSYHFQLFLSSGTSDSSWIDKFELSSDQVKSAPSNKIIQLGTIIAYFANSKSDIVICMTGRIVEIAFYVRKVFHKKYKIVSWIHFSLFDEKNVRYNKLHLADRHLAISSGIVEQLVSLGINEEDCYLVYNPVNVEKQVVINNKVKNEFVFIGRPELQGQKNLYEMFSILQQLKNYWHLTIYGSGEGLEETKKFVEDNGIINHVTFEGWVAEPWKHIHSATAVLLTSRYEGFPMVLVESLSHGIPVISSDCPVGPKDIVDNKHNGFLYTLGNIKQAALYLNSLNESTPLFSTENVKNSINKFSTVNYNKRFIKALNFEENE